MRANFIMFGLIRFIGPISFSLILVCFFIIVTIANSDFIDGRYQLHWDERLLFDQVKNIFHHDSKTQLISLILDSNDHRYGRIYYNINALFGYLPKEIYGFKGMIFSGRFTSSLFLFSSFIILILAFLKNWIIRICTLVILFNVPYCWYYMTMPKPEPMQLFFLSLFFYFFKNDNFILKPKNYWIFAGLALGAKISTVPILLVIFATGLYCSLIKSVHRKISDSFPKIILYTSLGLTISVPILLPYFIASTFIYIIITRSSWYKGWNKNYKTIALLVTVILPNFFISFSVKSVFGIQTGLSKWMQWTIFGTTHGADNSSINIFEWINYFFYDWIICPNGLSALLIFNCILIVSVILVNKKKINSPHLKNLIYSSALLIISGLFSIFLIFFNVKRIWGFYLFPSFTLIIVGMAILAEILISKKFSITSKTKILFFKLISLCFFLIFGWIVVFYWHSNNALLYKDFANRSNNKKYEVDYGSYLNTIDFLKNLSLSNGGEISVYYDDEVLFVPDPNEYFHVNSCLGPFQFWEYKAHALVFSEYRIKRLKGSHDSNEKNYPGLIAESIGYEKYVIDKDQECITEFCYRREKILKNGSEILVLETPNLLKP